MRRTLDAEEVVEQCRDKVVVQEAAGAAHFRGPVAARSTQRSMHKMRRETTQTITA